MSFFAASRYTNPVGSDSSSSPRALSQMASSSINLELHVSEDWALAPTAQAERCPRVSDVAGAARSGDAPRELLLI